VAQEAAVVPVAVSTWLTAGVPDIAIPFTLATSGDVAVPPKSPSSWTNPGALVVALLAVGAARLTHLLVPVL
jgi:hypothetical protein